MIVTPTRRDTRNAPAYARGRDARGAEVDAGCVADLGDVDAAAGVVPVRRGCTASTAIVRARKVWRRNGRLGSRWEVGGA